MGTQGTGRKRSTNKERSTAEDDALNLIAREAEARLAAKRAARAEAREIRMKELERQQKEEDSERFSRSSRLHTLSDDDERMSVGSRGSVRSDLDSGGAYGGGGSSLHRKSKKKKKHKHRDKNGCHDDYSALSTRSSRLSDDSRMSRSSRLDLQPSSFTSSDLLDLSGPSRNPGLSFNGYQSSLYDDGLSLCSGSRRVSASHPVEYSSYRSSRASSRASSARTSPVENCGSVASFVRSAVSGSALSRHLDDITIPDFPEVEDRDFDKGPRATVGGTSSRRGSGETVLTVDADSSVREIKEIHELKDQIQDVETKYQQNLKEAKEALAEVEEKYRKAMVSNAQLDNEKNNLMYQVDTLKDSLMELEELLSESRRQYDDKLKEFERQKHNHSVLQFQFDELKETLKQSEELLNEIRQLRLKQDGYVREISDLQETVEWKDKKIGALERQKEYSDAIRLERDELREETVKLKDILKKHGIVLGPDLNVNGDAGPSEVDGSAGAEPRPTQESQPTPAEGNGVLGSTEDLRACREEDVAPEQKDETLEDVKENRLSCDDQAPEAQTCFPFEESHLDGQKTVEPIDCPDPKAKAIIVVSQDLQQIQTSGETETSEVDSISHPGLAKTQSTGTEAAGGDLSGGQESKQEVVTTESLAKQGVPVGLNSESQQEPEEAENNEAEKTASKSQAQVSTASGKKKKKKKKVKKKDQQKAGTEKQNEKTSKVSVVQNNGLTAEQDTSESIAKPQDNQEPEKVKHLEPSENHPTKGNLQEPNTEGSEGHNQEKTTEGADVLGSTLVPHLGVEIIDDTQNQECEDPKKPNEGSAVESLKESEITGPDQEGNLVTCKSKDDPDWSEDAPARENTSDLQSTTDHVSGDEGKTGNTEMLEQSDTVGSSETSCHIVTRAELSEDEQNKETSPTAKETAGHPEGFFQDEPGEESVPESKTVEGNARETNLPSNKGNEGPNKHLPSCDDTATTPAFQEPNNDHVSGDQEEETLTFEMLDEAGAVESLETPDEQLVEVLQNQEETSEPEKHESVQQTTETSQAETMKGPNESETSEDVKEMESETGSDREANLLTSGKSEDPEEAFPPDSSSPEVQNVRTESESVDGDEKMIYNSESIVELAGEEQDGVPESRTGSEINEETSASSANDDARDQPETSSTSKSTKLSMREPEKAAEPDDVEPSETSEEICQDDEELNGGRGEPEEPPLHMKDEMELVDLTKAETGDTGSPPKEEQKEASAEQPEPEDRPNTEEVKTSQGPLAEQVKESMEEPEGDDSPPYGQLDEDDGEEDEGQSFDFDDLDVEAAVESALSNKLEQEDVKEGAEVNRKNPELCQSNAETKAEDGEVKVSEDDNSKVDQPSTQNNLLCGDDTPEKVGNVPENIEQRTSSTVEEGLDATKVPSDPQKTPEQTDGVPQAGKDPKKKKGKTKEDCKMS
ncbi:leucine-rich repeat flightless-interacting protein 1 isoform X5 [Gambusia affinis]|uniref:leucine-rich repeat flightless-interacting protein 1 isoform X5 n=1 Tax=Gambusia affinis TaxID=33528 RepID=UPI001CDD57C0|nr:leucine-rich repeat flightless-interacting protein 1 isoform X5 [Gambusia affinis]